MIGNEGWDGRIGRERWEGKMNAGGELGGLEGAVKEVGKEEMVSQSKGG